MKQRIDVEPVNVTIDSRLIAGVCEETSNAQEAQYEEAKIPMLWRQYFQASVLTPLKHEVEGAPAYAIYHDFKDGVHGAYSVLVGTEVSSDKDLGELFKSVELKPGNYLRFDAKGEMPMIVVETWQKIWRYFASNEAPKRAFKTDFEVYSGEDEFSIYISIE